MKEYSKVRLKVEKECYAKDNAHKGMTGWICHPQKFPKEWLVHFDECPDDMIIIGVKEADLEVLAE